MTLANRKLRQYYKPPDKKRALEAYEFTFKLCAGCGDKRVMLRREKWCGRCHEAQQQAKVDFAASIDGIHEKALIAARGKAS